jgi:hypothetical protein
MADIVWKGSTSLVEQPREYARGQTSAVAQKYRGPYATCVSSQPWPGALGTSSWANWRVVTSRVTAPAPGLGELTIQWEPANASAGATLPLTSLRMVSQPKPVHIIRAPRYSALRTEAFAKELWRYEHPKDDTELTAARAAIVSVGNGLSSGLGTEFAAKLDANVYEYEQPLWRIEIESHSWSFPTLSEGGTVGTTGPTLPDSATWPSGMRFRRLADSLAYNGSYYTLSSVWLAGAQGTLDSDLGV